MHGLAPGAQQRVLQLKHILLLGVLAHGALVIYNFLGSSHQRTDHVLLAPAQGGHVAHLIELALGLRAVAVHAADRQAQLRHGLHHRAHLARLCKRGQVQNHAGAHAGAGVRRTGRQKAPLGVEGEGIVLAHLLVQAQGHLGAALQLQARKQALEAHVILLVHHHGDRARRGHHRRRPAGELQKVVADHVVLHQTVARVVLQIVHAQQHEGGAVLAGED